MKNLLLLIFAFFCLNASAQKDLEEQARLIVEEGKRLYRSEMASWYGTDLFMEKYENHKNIKGYFSYTENEIAKCIFYSAGNSTKVIGTISFDSSYNLETAVIDLNERTFSSLEKDLYEIREIALKEINSDTLFKTYKNTNLNLIPIIHNGEKKVYILTGPQKNGVVIFGNDYLITFNNNNQLTGKKKLHHNIILKFRRA